MALDALRVRLFEQIGAAAGGIRLAEADCYLAEAAPGEHLRSRAALADSARREHP